MSFATHKFIILASVILLIGAGCSKSTKQSNNSASQKNNTAETSATPMETPKPKVSKVYYPEFLPEGITINKESLKEAEGLSQKNIITSYFIGDAENFENPYIYIRQMPKEAEWQVKLPEAPFVKITSTGDPKLKNLNGIKYSKKVIDEDDEQITNTVIFAINDSVISLSTKNKFFDLDTLEKIAESMK